MNLIALEQDGSLGPSTNRTSRVHNDIMGEGEEKWHTRPLHGGQEFVGSFLGHAPRLTPNI